MTTHLPGTLADRVRGQVVRPEDDDYDEARGVYNATAPEPVTNKVFSKALGKALGRPAVVPVPKLAVKVRFGSEFGEQVTGGQRALPRRALDDGYRFRHPDIESGLAAALAQV